MLYIVFISRHFPNMVYILLMLWVVQIPVNDNDIDEEDDDVVDNCDDVDDESGVDSYQNFLQYIAFQYIQYIHLEVGFWRREFTLTWPGL